MSSLQQTELFSPADGRLTVVHPELVENIFGVSTQGVQRHHEFAGNFRTFQIGREQPEHFEFSFGQRLDQMLSDGRFDDRLSKGVQQLPHIVRDIPTSWQSPAAVLPWVGLRQQRGE